MNGTIIYSIAKRISIIKGKSQVIVSEPDTENGTVKDVILTLVDILTAPRTEGYTFDIDVNETDDNVTIKLTPVKKD